MKRLLVISDQPITPNQLDDELENWDIREVITIPDNLKTIWETISPEATNFEVQRHIQPVWDWLEVRATTGDIALINGDVSATLYVANRVWTELGVTPVYATRWDRIRVRLILF